MIRFSRLFVILSAVFISVPTAVQQQESPPPASKGKVVVQDRDPDRVARRDYMRTKLMYSQNILEGLIRGDFDLINTGINEIQRVT